MNKLAGFLGAVCASFVWQHQLAARGRRSRCLRAHAELQRFDHSEDGDAVAYVYGKGKARIRQVASYLKSM